MSYEERLGRPLDSASSPTPTFLERTGDATQTINLDSVYTDDLTATGSFDLRLIEATSLGKLFDAVPIPIFVFDKGNAIAFGNRSAAAMIGADESARTTDLSSLFAGADIGAQIRDIVQVVLSKRESRSIETVLGRPADRMYGRLHFRPIRWAGERFALLLIEDLTNEKKQLEVIKRQARRLRESHEHLEVRVRERTAELGEAVRSLKKEIVGRRQAESSLTLAANVIRSSNEAIVITDTQSVIIDVNEAFCRVTGYTREEVIGKTPRIMSSGRHDTSFWQSFWEALHREGHWQGEVWDRRKNGEIFPKKMSVSAVTGESNERTHYVGIFSDISSIKKTEKELDILTRLDPLTGLINRNLFRDRLKQAVSKAYRRSEGVAVLILDLDNFKKINDTMGHSLGDDLLKEVGVRLVKAVRPTDTVARLAGDEFAIMITDFAVPRSIDFLAMKIMRVMAEAYDLGNRRVFVTAAMGISLYPGDGDSEDLLLQHADTAMYSAKEQGPASFRYYSKEMNRHAAERLEIETDLREGMLRDEFLLYYQPQVSLANGAVCGCEALVRWRRPSKGIVPPGVFIPLAEETGLIKPLGDWVLGEACRQAKAWITRTGDNFPVGVNLSAVQLKYPDTIEQVTRLLEANGIEGRRLTLELTESAVMGDPEDAVRILYGLKALGVQIALDDFGTGYSSLYYLKRFPLDKLKIDRSFVEEVTVDADDEAIVRAIIGMAHNLNLKVVAEGVETEEQLEFLRSEQCDEVQGYYHGRPVPPDEFEQSFLGG
ncbi:MAG: EAL domain-containing protein [Pseudomonadota bacterium]